MRYIEDEDETVRIPGKKKDTSKFCKGNPKHPHEGEWVLGAHLFAPYYILTCKNCSKQLSYCWGWSDKKCVCGMHKRSENAG